LHRLAERSIEASADKPRELRVRVSNDAASAVDEFQITWLDKDDKPLAEPISAYVPAGESRVVRIPRPPDAAAAQRLHLTGDDCEFDNTLYLAARAQADISVVYIGSDTPNDPQGPRYYLERALANGLSPPVELVAPTPEEALEVDSPVTTPLVVLTTEPTPKQAAGLRDYIEAGGTVFLVLMEKGNQGKILSSLLGVGDIAVAEAEVAKYAMLGQIAFDHPLFAPMAGPHFNDFTQIHFWKYRKLIGDRLGDATIVARFENGDPALVESRMGKGRVYVLATGWQPSDSQLARSWKFVLLVAALVEGRNAGRPDRVYYVVNERVPLDEVSHAAGTRMITKPDGEKVSLPPEARDFRGDDRPGLYSIDTADGPQGFAVNLDPAESRTSALPVESLEQLGCRLVSPAAVAENQERNEQLRDVQLESRQKLWQWLIGVALGLLVGETWFAGRIAKQTFNTLSPLSGEAGEKR
jgi:hypothetical protein